MAAIVSSPLPIVTTKLLDVGSAKSISAYDFLHGLKRPPARKLPVSASREGKINGPDSSYKCMKEPSILPTYARNTTPPVLPVGEKRDCSPLLCSQGPLEENEQHDGDPIIAQISPGEFSSPKLSERQSQQAPASNSQDASKHNRGKSAQKKRKRKQRRITLNELELVPSLPVSPDPSAAVKVSPNS